MTPVNGLLTNDCDYAPVVWSMIAMAKLIRIVYCSRNCVVGSRAEVEIQIRNILAVARTRNREAHLTGALAFNEECFAQVLEGSPAEIRPVFDRIRRDTRHRDVKILSETQASRRFFPQWSMAYVDTSDGDGRHPLSHFSFEAALINGAAPEAAKLLNALRRIIVLGSQ